MSGTASHFTEHVPVTHGGRLAFDPRGRQNLLDFSVNTTPLGIPPAVLRAIRRSAVLASEYPDPESSELLSALSKYTGLSKPHLLAGNGAIDLIYGYAFAFGRGCKTLIPAPTFQEYEAASRMYHGASRMIHFETVSLSSDLDKFVRLVPDCGGTVFVCNPNNPTGEILTRRQILEIVDAAAAVSTPDHPCNVMVDECFIEMSEKPRESVISRVQRYDNLTVVRSLTKSFCIPGIRAGYAAASPEIIDTLSKARPPWSVNRLAEAAGVAALQNARNILKATRDVIRKEITYLQDRLSRLDGVSYRDTAANFMLLNTKLTSGTIQRRMARQKGILVRDCSGFRGLGNRHVRIAVKRHKENAALLNALGDLLS